MARKKKVEAELEIVSITRSYSRKLNMAAHGGKQYETADLTCSLTANVTEENVEEASEELMKLCIADVDKTIDAIDGEADDVEEAEVKPKKKKKMLNVGVKVEQEEMEEMQSLVNDLTLAKTSKDLAAAAKSIKAGAKDLNKSQKAYLSAYYMKRKEAIS